MKETKAPTLYLCGAIAGKTDDECKGWRNLAAARWAEQYGGRVFDPMRHDYRYTFNMRDDGMAEKIVEDDKREIRAADGLLVWWEGPSVGTSMEIFYAHLLGKPIVIVIPGSRFPYHGNLSPWLYHHITHLTTTLDMGLMMLGLQLGVAKITP